MLRKSLFKSYNSSSYLVLFLNFTLSKSLTTLASNEIFSSYSIHKSEISLAARLQYHNHLQRGHVFRYWIMAEATKQQRERERAPRGPPPSKLHICSIASRSIRLFSSFGIPSEGVISPTIAIIAIKRNNSNTHKIRKHK